MLSRLSLFDASGTSRLHGLRASSNVLGEHIRAADCRIATVHPSPFKVGQHGGVLSGREAGQEVSAPQPLERVAQRLTRRRVGIDVAPVGIDEAEPVASADQYGGHCWRAQRRRVLQRGRAGVGSDRGGSPGALHLSPWLSGA